MIAVKGAQCGYGKRTVLGGVDVLFENGKLTAVVGPNGCGKTTLLRAVCGDIKLMGGRIEIDGIDAAGMGRRTKARRVARFHQERTTPEMTVRRLAEAGRYPLMPFVGRMGKADIAAVERAMKACGVERFSQRMLSELSGGERQRAYIAMLMAQEAKNLLLDEPAAFLDPGARFEMMDMLKDLARDGYAVGVVMHDIALAMEYADSIIVMDRGCAVQGDAQSAIYAAGRAFGIGLERTDSGAYAVVRRGKTDKN